MNESIRYDAHTHEYWLDYVRKDTKGKAGEWTTCDYGGSHQLISVTQLLKKHGISRSYDNIDKEILRAKAERGTLIHKYLENFIKTGEKPIFDVSEIDSFERWLKENNTEHLQSEQIVYSNLVAGTIDLVGYRNCKCADHMQSSGGELFFVDFKTSAILDYDACRWQLSLYCYLHQVGLTSVGGGYRGGYNESHNLSVLHFQADGSIQEVKFSPVPHKDLIDLLEQEKLSRIKYPNNYCSVILEKNIKIRS